MRKKAISCVKTQEKHIGCEFVYGTNKRFVILDLKCDLNRQDYELVEHLRYNVQEFLRNTLDEHNFYTRINYDTWNIEILFPSMVKKEFLEFLNKSLFFITNGIVLNKYSA